MARYGNANQPARSRQLHRHDRASPGFKNRVPRRSGVSNELYRAEPTRAHCGWIAERRISRVFTDGLRRGTGCPESGIALARLKTDARLATCSLCGQRIEPAL